jgi:SAM-dependent methyltransferase
MTIISGPEIDQDKAQAFVQKLTDILVGGRLSLMLSIGHQTGLFDTMSQLAPSTSVQVAEAAGLNERYVREWLAAMVTSRMIEYDPEGGTYRLPPEHASALTRAAGLGNRAVMAMMTTLLAQTEESLIACFRQGGGVPYRAFEGFARIMAENSAGIFDATLLQRTLPAVPGVVERLQAGIDVADIACGSGHAINLMARAFPASRFAGFDFAEDAIEAARAEAASWGLTNTRFETADVEALGLSDAFDLITVFDGIHDQAQPATVLRNIAQALRAGGTFLMVDIAASSHLHENMSDPFAPSKYTISTMHCMTVSLAQGGAGLGTMWGEHLARQMLADAGFTVLEVMRIDGDPNNYYYIVTR